MASTTYDLAIVGGGLGGSTLAFAMARNGTDVLVLESEANFRDRVRGEVMAPWGAYELEALGIYETLMSSAGHQLDYEIQSSTGERIDFVSQSIYKMPTISFYHPDMQEALLQAAEDEGARVIRGARVTDVNTNEVPRVKARIGDRGVEFQARLVVGADGRGSMTRKWAGFEVRHDKDNIEIAGGLLEDSSAPDDCFLYWRKPYEALFTLAIPLGGGRIRAYVCHNSAEGSKLSGEKDLDRLIEQAVRTGAPEEYYQGVKLAGPLATFNCAPTWINHPYRCGVALIGDAAYSSDPSIGQGLSLTVRDSRVLRDKLLHTEDWEEAGNAYAQEHDQYARRLHIYENWLNQIAMTKGPEADALRDRVFPLWQEDPTRRHNLWLDGPDMAVDEQARRRFFGEE